MLRVYDGSTERMDALLDVKAGRLADTFQPVIVSKGPVMTL